MVNYRTVAELLTKEGSTEAAPLSELIKDAMETWSRPITNRAEHSAGITDSLKALREAAQALTPKEQAAGWSSFLGKPFAWGRSIFSRGSAAEVLPEATDQTRSLAFTNAAMLDRAVKVAHSLSHDVSNLTHQSPAATGLRDELGMLSAGAHDHSRLLSPNVGSDLTATNLRLDKDSLHTHGVAVQKFLSGLESASLAAAPNDVLRGLQLGAQAGTAIEKRALSEIEIKRLGALKAVMLDENVRIAHALALDGVRFSGDLAQSGKEVPGLYSKALELSESLGKMREQTTKQANELLKHPALRFVT
jgi:hypothetical protein